MLLRADGELRRGLPDEEKIQALRVTAYSSQTLIRAAEEALAAIGREDEAVVRGLAEFEYRKAPART